MELTEHKFEELSALKYHIYTTRLPHLLECEVLIVAFEGEYGYGCRGNSDAAYIHAIIMAAEASWEHSCFVLDYRNMRYDWGDRLPLTTGQNRMTAKEHNMLRLFGSIPKCSATLISDLNREAIHSLLDSDYGYDASALAGSDISWLFESLDAALAAFENARRQFQAESVDLL